MRMVQKCKKHGMCVFGRTGKRASLFLNISQPRINIWTMFHLALQTKRAKRNENEWEKNHRPSCRRILAMDTLLNVSNVQQHFLHGIRSLNIFLASLLTNCKSWMPFLLLVVEFLFHFLLGGLQTHRAASLKFAFHLVRAYIFLSFFAHPPTQNKHIYFPRFVTISFLFDFHLFIVTHKHTKNDLPTICSHFGTRSNETRRKKFRGKFDIILQWKF